MASVRALNSARTWTFAGDLRSYLLCCFSFNQSPSKKRASKSETDVELAQYLDDIEPQTALESVVGIECPTDGETVDHYSQVRLANDAEASTDDATTSDLCSAANEIHPQWNTSQTEHELRDDEPRHFSSHRPSDLTKETSAESLPPGAGADPNQQTDAHLDARREPLANGLLRPRCPLDSTPCKDNGRPDEDGDVDRGSSEQTMLLLTTATKESEGSTGDAPQEIAHPDSDEKLFDVSDLQEVSKCGRIHVTLDYSFTRKRLNVTVHEACEIPNEERGGSTNTQVRLALLPTKKSRHKTKIIRASENPKYDETFQFKLPTEELNRCGLRLRLYGCERLSRERMIGECVVRFVNLNLEKPSSNWFTLEPRISFADSDRSSLGRRSRSSSAASSSSQSVEMEGMEEGSSELLLSLAYNAVTGRLTVDVLQGTNLKYLTTNRPPDTFVRVTLMSAGGKELTRSNTSVRKMSPNPVYREKFMFQVVETQLAEVSLMVSVYAKRSLRREELVGWFILGFNNSGEDELLHWNDMRASGGSEVERWHVLAEP